MGLGRGRVGWPHEWSRERPVGIAAQCVYPTGNVCITPSASPSIHYIGLYRENPNPMILPGQPFYEIES